MPIKKRLEILSLGDELLLGLRDNTHLAYLGRELARKGLSIARDQEIRDNAEEIRSHFLDTWHRADIVITTGGLGPTADDITRETIADALGLKLVLSEAVLESIGKRLHDIGMEMNPLHKRQALIPEGAEVLPNSNGTAPGIWLDKDGKILVMLPGPGIEMRPIFMEQVLPRLEARDIALINDAFLQLRACGMTESEMNLLLNPVLATMRGRVNASFSQTCSGIVDIRLEATDVSVSWKDIEQLGERCRAVLGDNFLGYGDVSIAEVVVRLLRENGRTISVAESCTGGLLSNAFAEIPGVSKVFRGGVVCYNNDIKQDLLDVPESILQQHGAVSAETSVALAMGAQERMDSDYALSITGYAGPEGGAVGSEPVGTIYIGLATPEGVWSRKVFLMGTRQNVRQRAVILALDWIRRMLISAAPASAEAAAGLAAN
jgi:nicotinamide-nucleotide amidase